ncbi:tigger transposable element-derived protein 3-like [Heptranchias perlo]|uniref:tigger transposable element-derived protein 3-like n=1 Tax=Heptranchias perlo TaxID=212740 RepID=UPI00355A26BD
MAKFAAKNKELTLAEKMKVIEALSGPKISQRLLGRRFGVSQPQICRIIKNKEQLVSEWRNHVNPGRKRRRDGKAPPVEDALLRWFGQARAAGETVTGPAMKQAARSLAAALGREGFWPSNGWLSRFKMRHNIAFGGPRGRRRGGDGRGRAPTAQRGYPPGDVYCCAQAAVCLGGTGGALEALLCASADGGDKRRLLVAGRGPEPLCLRGLDARALPADYLSGGEGLTAERFAAWLADFDREMGRQGRRVAVIAEAGRGPPARPPALGNVRLLSPPPGPSPAPGYRQPL